MEPPTSPIPGSDTAASEAGTLETQADDEVQGGSVALRVGDRIGRYELIERLGQGAMGVVWAAMDPELDRRVAVKLVRSMGTSKTAHARLQREAKALAKLAHPNVVGVHDVGTFRERVFVAMEYVDGQTLREWAADGERSVREVLEVFQQAGRGLAGAHAAGLVHRDFKPDNVMVGEDRRVRVMDFGLARGEAESTGGADETSRTAEIGDPDEGSLDVRLTRTGALLGTPAYMAPEQFGGVVADERSDQFAFCVALYQALYGERPFAGNSVMKLAVNTSTGVVRPEPKGSAVPRWIRPILLRGLQPRPADRWPSMDALLVQLARDPVRRRRRRIAAALGVAAVGALVVGAWYGGKRGAAGPTKCTDADAPVAEVWNDAARTQIRDAFGAVDVGFQDATAERVIEALDGYALRMGEGRTEACQATHVSGVQSGEMLDRRMACLDARADALEATLRVFAEPDKGVVAQAVQAVGGLPSIEYCADAEALLEEAPPPDDPDLARRYGAAREALATVDALQRAGKITEARQAVAPIVEEAEAIGHASLLTSALYASGSVAMDDGDGETSAEQLERAYFLALESEQGKPATMASGLLVYVHGETLGDPEGAERWSRPALAHARATEDDLAIARVKLNLGSAAYAGHDLEGARAHFEEAYELRVRVQGEDDADVATALNNLANSEHGLGNRERAEQLGLRALAIRERVLGPDHIDVAMSLNNLAAYAKRRGDLETAGARHDRAVAIRKAAFGPDHPSYATSLMGSADVERQRGNLEEALRRYETAERIFATKVGAAHRLRLMAVLSAAQVELTLGRPDAAVRRIETVLPEARQTRSDRVADLLNWVANRHLDAGRLDRAAELFAESLERCRERKHGPSTLSHALSGLGRARGFQGRFDEALPLLDEAVDTGKEEHAGALARFRRAVALDDRRANDPNAMLDALAARDQCTRAGPSCVDELIPQIDEWLAERGAKP